METNENDSNDRNNNQSDISNSNEQQNDLSRPDLTNSVLFHGVTYLGSTAIQSPQSEQDVQKMMSILNEQSSFAVDVTLCVPDNPDGSVRLVDPHSELEIISYRINQILFCSRAPPNSFYSCCWAFTTSHMSVSYCDDSDERNSQKKSQSETIFQCQVFRCNNEDAIHRILTTFGNTFRRTISNSTMKSSTSSLSLSSSSSSIRRPTSFFGQAFQSKVSQNPQSSSFSSSNSSMNFDGSVRFRAQLDIKEESIDNKGNQTLNAVPRPEKNVFRLCKDLRKLIVVQLQQIRGVPLTIERCFGLLLAQGRNVPASDMQLLDLETMSKSDDNRYTIRAHWDPSGRNFKNLIHLNEETSKGARVFFTMALDVVISGIYEPVRFLIESKARVCRSTKSNENFSQDITDTILSSFKKIPPFIEEFELILKQIPSKNLHQQQTYEVLSLESKSQSERQAKSRRLISVSNSNDEDYDETVHSGCGDVSKDCDEQILTNWNEILIKWKKNYAERPRGLWNLVQQGIPQALRCEVWQLLAGSIENENEMIENYRMLVTKNSSSERVILNDIDRTFPNHEYFKTGSIGQESLYKLSRAYSVRDEEVGYCQGLSFVIATLLIHIPEEQAFVLLCKLMEDKRYGLRALYKTNFENLQLRFHQLNCLIEENIPQLSSHFNDIKIECHMFASQWFLTLFTAKFPLSLVFRIVDIFLYEGFNTLFSVSLALLKCNQKDLLSLDFEGVMRYFRVNLPRKYINENFADELMQTVCSIKINPKKLERYEKDYFFRRFEEEERENPLQRLESENKRLTELSLRSELENEVLALELVQDRVQLKQNLDQAEDQIENLKEELEATKDLVRNSEELTVRLNEELKLIRQAFQNTCDELQRTQKDFETSKQMCSLLNDQLVKEKQKFSNNFEFIQRNSCEPCQLLILSSLSNKISPSNEDLPMDFGEISSLTEARLRQVEIELAEKKLALTEALCENQELLRQIQHSTSTMKNESERTQFSFVHQFQGVHSN